MATSADLSLETLLEDVAPIGWPLAGVTAHLCDASGGLLEQPGAQGELYLSGPMLAEGYLGRSDLTRERFICLADGQRAYRTGDIVSRGLSGQLYFRGRTDDELKISGYRIAPAEVEATIRGHELIRHAVVWGEAAKGGAHHLCVAVESIAPLNLSALKDFVKEKLPSAMVPTHWKLVERLPLTSSGKLDRKRIQREANDARQSTKDELLASTTAPAGTEATIVQVLAAWRDVLGVHQIGAEQNFFDLGGSSLHLIQLANRLSQIASKLSTAPTIRVAELFKRTTPTCQAEWLGSRSSSELPEFLDAERLFSPAPVQVDLRTFTGVPVSTAETETVLLTGVTGFLGIYLLDAWLRLSASNIVCLVRAKSDRDAWSRIESQARAFGLDPLAMRERVEVVSLSETQHTKTTLQARLEICHAVVHCAAQVSLTRDYQSLLASNVTLTRDLLEWAAQVGAEFHLISTIATLPIGEVDELFYPNHEGLRDGYQQSKAHAEWLCQSAAEQGLKVAVHRLGRVVGARRLPQVNANDLVWRIARSSARVGLWPNVKVSEPWAPVDELADSLVALALQDSAASPGNVFHLVQHGAVELDQVRHALMAVGIELLPVAVSEWMEAVRAQADQEDLATLAFFEMRSSGSAEVSSILPSCEQTRARLGTPEDARVDQSFIVRLCESAKRSGILIPSDPASRKP